MEEVTEGDLLGLDLPRRERRWSGGSNHSNDRYPSFCHAIYSDILSSFSNFFQSVPGMTATTLEDIESDRESTVDEHGSAIVKSASKEQVSPFFGYFESHFPPDLHGSLEVTREGCEL